jgi:hypothetical protein
MSACGKPGCGKRAVYMVSVPSYQQDACANHLADMVEVVAGVYQKDGLRSVTVWRSDSLLAEPEENTDG